MKRLPSNSSFCAPSGRWRSPAHRTRFARSRAAAQAFWRRRSAGVMPTRAPCSWCGSCATPIAERFSLIRSASTWTERQAPAQPIVAVEGDSSNPDLGGKVRDHCRREVGLLVGEGAVTPPVGVIADSSQNPTLALSHWSVAIQADLATELCNRKGEFYHSGANDRLRNILISRRFRLIVLFRKDSTMTPSCVHGNIGRGRVMVRQTGKGDGPADGEG